MKKAILSLLLAACTLTLAAQEAATDSLTADTLTLAQRLDSLVAKNMPQGSNVGIAIYDLGGRIVASTTQATVSTSQLPRGVYVAVVTTSNGKLAQKFVK